jgi:hypothetical protein
MPGISTSAMYHGHHDGVMHAPVAVPMRGLLVVLFVRFSAWMFNSRSMLNLPVHNAQGSLGWVTHSLCAGAASAWPAGAPSLGSGKLMQQARHPPCVSAW